MIVLKHAPTTDDRADGAGAAGDDADHAPLASLEAILEQRRIVASDSMIRGQTPVVSFTAVAMVELPQLRTFRPHRGCWDFEPYGIGIDQEWLSRRGAREVIYGDDDVWQSLSDDDRPFFQLQETRGRRDREPIDWTVEREWRHVGDVDLSEIPPNAAVVFVPSREEAQRIARVSRWPVTVIPELAKK